MSLNDIKQLETVLIKQLLCKELTPLQIEKLFDQYHLEKKPLEELNYLLESLMETYLSTVNVILRDNLDCITNLIHFHTNTSNR